MRFAGALLARSPADRADRGTLTPTTRSTQLGMNKKLVDKRSITIAFTVYTISNVSTGISINDLAAKGGLSKPCESEVWRE
ncbi:hypothetical protein PG994_000767 [Apiospora phragmitis]|uniref:Uncharacterized protein n=1 Tax=Apiospora phragmitis TaxID=2905665 RepID=A0ABR1X7F5_9PEZI